MANGKEISRAVILRIPRYYRHILELQTEGVQRISSRALADRMGLTASQIRQDFNCFGGFGQQGYGYNIEKLREELAEILGLNKDRTAVLVGVGNIGRALIKNFRFGVSGFRLLFAFDTDKTIIGTEQGGIRVRDSSELCDFVTEHKPDIAVLTIPRDLAPEMAKELVARGIRGIWNFTGEDLHLEGLGVPVENVHFSDSLMTLCYQVDDAEQTQTQ